MQNWLINGTSRRSTANDPAGFKCRSGRRAKTRATLSLFSRYQNVRVAERAVDWLLRYFDIAAVGRAELVRARALGWEDFEDGAVAAAAESIGCKIIVTRNVRGFEGSPVPAMTPEEYLLELSNRRGP